MVKLRKNIEWNVVTFGFLGTIGKEEILKALLNYERDGFDIDIIDITVNTCTCTISFAYIEKD